METLQLILESILDAIEEESFRKKYVKGENAFIRNRKMPLKDAVLFVLCNTRTQLSEEIYNFCEKAKLSQVTAAAVVKARAKIDSRAFEYLLEVCNRNIKKIKTYKGRRILAVDGMKGELPKTSELMAKNSRKKDLFPTFHAMIIHDLLNDYYTQGVFEVGVVNEREVARRLLEKWASDEGEIYIYDRGFPEVTLIQLLEEKGKSYVMRISSSFLIELQKIAEKGSEDEIIHIDYDRWKGKNKGKVAYSFDVRMVKIELSSGESELLITNLSQEEFSRKELGELYGMRWGIETSFEKLKYSLFIENFISKKEDSIRQEFYASLIAYNLCSSLINEMGKAYNAKKKRQN